MHKIIGKGVFNIYRRGTVKTTRNDNSFLECRSDKGLIAFWGSAGNNANIQQILVAPLPCQVECDIAAPSLHFNHDHWVPEHGKIIFLPGSTQVPPEGTPSP